MKRHALLLGLCLVLLATAISAAPAERYFKFNFSPSLDLNKIGKIISIDNVTDGAVYAYANDSEWEAFLKLGIEAELLPNPSTLAEPAMSDSKDALGQWDTYPTYEAYVDWMYSFETNYPGLCRIVNIGSSVEGRDLLFAVISDNVDTEEDEPEVMYTCTMHGDETAGYITSIRLIDSLLVAYGTDPEITRYVDSMEIWINPAANPDGTYAGGNSTVSGATRYNANGIDLNRNFIDFEDGPHPDGNAWQIETIAMMDLADSQNFVISANLHGGAEVANYPWDTWADRHPDNDWWYDACRAYADTAHNYSPSGYLSDLDNGVTNGYDWYTTSGNRQDYMNYYHGCREMTLEISNTKLPSASTLPNYWEYNKRSLLQYLENALYGVRGLVTDSAAGTPLAATIRTLNHDVDSAQSWVYTDPDVGDYHRMLEAGTYTLVFTAPGYYPDTVSGITVTDYHSTRVDVALAPLPNEPVLVFVDADNSSSQPGDDVTMDVTVENIGIGNATGLSATLFTDDELITVTQAASTYPNIQAEGGIGTNNTAFEFTIADTAALFHVAEFALEFTDGVDFTDTVTFDFMIGDRVVFFYDDFSSDLGWSGYGGSAQWERDEAGGLGGDPSQDHSISSDDYVAGNDLTGDGKYNNGITTTQYLISPAINCIGRTGIEIRFWQWLGCESSQYDHCYFQVHDGSGWVTLYSNPGSDFQESAWTEQYYDVSAYADNNAQFRIRFGMGSSDGSETYSGWNIDDVEIKGYGSAGSPEMAIEPTAIEDSLQPGDQEQQTLKVRNTGDGVLDVWFSSNESWLQITTDKQSVSPADSQEVTVTILSAGLAGGDHAGAINYTSSDPSNASGSIPVDLYLYEPDVYVEVSDITENVTPDGQDSYPLLLTNNGEGRLIYQVQTFMDPVKSARTIDRYSAEIIGSFVSDIDKPGSRPENSYAPMLRSSGGPDAFGHQWLDSDEAGGPTFDWVDITTVGTEVFPSDDGYIGPFDVGFAFPMYDSAYTEFYLGANGFITFDTGYGIAGNILLPDASFNSSIISMWWDDLLCPDGGEVFYYYDSANDRLVISFINVPNYLSGLGTGSLTFQAILYASGKIVLQYDTMTPGDDPDGLNGATIGIQNSLGNDGLTIVYNAAYMHNQLAIEISTVNWLSVANPTGTVEPYSDDTVMVLFDATDLDNGSYTGQLVVNTNDGDSPAVTIPVTMTISSGCCIGRVGNVDNDPADQTSLGDLTALIDMLFVSFTPAPCLTEADLDLSGQPDPQVGDVSLADLTALIDHLFVSFNDLPLCP